MSAPRLHHLALRVADVARAAAFYEAVLELRVHSAHREQDGSLRSVWLLLGEGALLMLERSLRGVGPDAGSGHVLVLAVSDLAAWERRLFDLRVAIVDRTLFTLFFRDPDGHRVGVSTFPVASP